MGCEISTQRRRAERPCPESGRSRALAALSLRRRLHPGEALVHAGRQLWNRHLQATGQPPQNAHRWLLLAAFHQGDEGTVQVDQACKRLLRQFQLKPPSLDGGRQGLNQQ